MKIIIEDKDLKEVQRIAHDYYAIVLTDEQAKFLIEKDTNLGGFWQGEWSWPCNGDSDEFKNEFDLEFRKAATNIGLELIAEVWDSKV